MLKGEDTEITKERSYEGVKENYKQPKIEILKNHEVNIAFMDVGMVIRVGCKSLAFTSIEQGMLEFSAYVKDPHTARSKWEQIFNENNK